MNPLFEKLFSQLRMIGMTPAEKHAIRMHLSHTMRRVPVGRSFMLFRYSMVSVLALMLFIGSGGALTFASQSSLPGDRLFVVKLKTEQVHKATLGSPSAKASYDLALIEKRFGEVNQLISDRSLDDKSEAAATLAIQTHAKDVKIEADALAITAPAEALSYNTRLAKALTTGTNILLALSDQSFDEAKVAARTPNTLVLATYATAQGLSADTAELEMIVMSDTNIATVKTAERKYAAALALLKKHEIEPVVTIAATTAVLTVETPTVSDAKVSKEVTISINQESPDKKISSESTPSTAIPAAEPDTYKQSIQELANKLRTAYDAKKYGEVIILSDRIEQNFHDAATIDAVEKTYNIVIPNSGTTPPADAHVMTNTTVESGTATDPVSGTVPVSSDINKAL